MGHTGARCTADATGNEHAEERKPDQPNSPSASATDFWATHEPLLYCAPSNRAITAAAGLPTLPCGLNDTALRVERLVRHDLLLVSLLLRPFRRLCTGKARLWLSKWLRRRP